MKGRTSNTRYRLKRAHGGRAGRPDAGHALKSGMYRDGGECDGQPAAKNLARGGRMKRRQDGGPIKRFGKGSVQDTTPPRYYQGPDWWRRGVVEPLNRVIGLNVFDEAIRRERERKGE